MPFELRPLNSSDALSWTRIRSLAYYGPTQDVIHNGPIRESSIHGLAEERKRNWPTLNTWQWKVVDSELEPSADDPPDNGGRTIAVSVWSMHNIKKDGSDEPTTNPAAVQDETPAYVPPELRLDALTSLFAPLRAAQKEIMGTTNPYFMLNSLATHPEHQGRGAARMMLDWGIEKAEKENLPIYLDATSRAKPLYERRNFVVVMGIEWDREPWGGEGLDKHWCMVRQIDGAAG